MAARFGWRSGGRVGVNGLESVHFRFVADLCDCLYRVYSLAPTRGPTSSKARDSVAEMERLSQ